MDTNWKNTDDKIDNGARKERGGLPLLFALVIGLSLLLHTATLLLLGGWHGLADLQFLRGDLARHPDYAQAMADLYRAAAVCVVGAGDAMGQPTGELTIISRDEAALFDAAMEEYIAMEGTADGFYWQGGQVDLSLGGEQALSELQSYLADILQTDGQNGIGQVGVAVIGPDGVLQADYPVAAPFNEDGQPAVPAGWRLELFWDGETLTTANEKILAAYQNTAYDIRPLEEGMAQTKIAIITRSWDETDGLLSSWYFSNATLRIPAHRASVDHALSVLSVGEGAVGLLLVLPALIFRRRRIGGAASLARFTGWFLLEFKLAALVVAAMFGVFLFWSVVINYWYLTEMAVILLGFLCLLAVATLALLMTDFIHNGRAVFQNNLFRLARRMVGGLTADSTLERKLSTRIWLAALPSILGCAGLVLLFFAVLWNGGPSGAGMLLLVLLCAAMIPIGGVLLLWVTLRASHTMGALAKQVAALAAGGEATALCLSESDSFAPMQRDLMNLQQGVRRVVEAQLQSERISMQSERMKVELIANVSHDLKTPLTSVVNYADLLCEEPLASPADHYAQVLREKAYRLKTMVQDVFEISKAASGALPLAPERIDLARLIGQTLADMDEKIAACPLEFKVNLTPRQMVYADGAKLYRVFQNLIDNALKYAMPDSRVYIDLAPQQGCTVARVRNVSARALDIPPEELTERFVRGDASRTDGGSGLGLSIAKTFTEACGGSFGLRFDADLVTATVSLPLLDPEPEDEKTPPTQSGDDAQESDEAQAPLSCEAAAHSDPGDPAHTDSIESPAG